MAKQVEIDTRLGKQMVSLDRVIHFPRGLIGFENFKDFTLLQIREGASMLVLQSMDDPGLGLLVADPFSFMEKFSLRLSDAEQSLIKAENPEQVTVLATVHIPPGKPEETSLNLSGPILVNHETKLGLQVPQADPTQPCKLYLHQHTVEK